MIEKRMIAVCDILGFKELVMKNNLEFVIKHCMGYFRKALYHSIHQKNPPSELPTLEELKKQSRVGFDWFSDTVLLYSLGDSIEDYKNVIQTVAWLVFYNIFYHPTSIRAGISYGDAFIGNAGTLPLFRRYAGSEKIACPISICSKRCLVLTGCCPNNH